MGEIETQTNVDW